MDQNIRPSKIANAYANYKENLDKVQMTPLIFFCTDYKQSMESNRVHATLSDSQYSQPSIFSGEALTDFDHLSLSSSDFFTIKLLKWQISLLQANYVMIVLKFIKIECPNLQQYQCIQFNPERHLQSTKFKRILFQHQKKNNQQIKVEEEPEIEKKIKIDNQLLLIKNLTPNMQQWIFQGRVFSKTSVQKMKFNPNEQMIDYIKIIIIDEENELITGLITNNEQFSSKIQINQVYTFKNGLITWNNNSKTISFIDSSTFEKSENLKIPQSPIINPLQIQEILQLKESKCIDLVAVIYQIEISTETYKSLYLSDQTGSIKLILLGPQSQTNVFKVGSILVLKNLNVKVTGGIRNEVISIFDTVILNEHDYQFTSRAQSLRVWFQISKQNLRLQPNQPKDTLNSLKQLVQKFKQEGQIEHIQPKQIQAFILEFKEYNIIYPSCPSNFCQRKMIQISKGKYKCQKCESETENPLNRYDLRVLISDETASIEVFLKDDIARHLIGIPAEIMKQKCQNFQRERLIQLTFTYRKIKLRVQFPNQNTPYQPQYYVINII